MAQTPGVTETGELTFEKLKDTSTVKVKDNNRFEKISEKQFYALCFCSSDMVGASCLSLIGYQNNDRATILVLIYSSCQQ